MSDKRQLPLNLTVSGTKHMGPRPQSLSRMEDPRTSVRAAKKNVSTSWMAVYTTEKLMEDGQPRIDEEIMRGVHHKFEYNKTLSAFQHARLVLQEVGILRYTGVDRPTSNGDNSKEWVIDFERQKYLFDNDVTGQIVPPPPKKLSYEEVEEALPHLVAAAELFSIQSEEPTPDLVTRLLEWIDWDAKRRRIRDQL